MPSGACDLGSSARCLDSIKGSSQPDSRIAPPPILSSRIERSARRTRCLPFTAGRARNRWWASDTTWCAATLSRLGHLQRPVHTACSLRGTAHAALRGRSGEGNLIDFDGGVWRSLRVSLGSSLRLISTRPVSPSRENDSGSRSCGLSIGMSSTTVPPYAHPALGDRLCFFTQMIGATVSVAIRYQQCPKGVAVLKIVQARDCLIQWASTANEFVQ